MSIDGKVDHDARAHIGLANDLTVPAHGAGAFLDSVQAEMFTVKAARQGDGWIETFAIIRSYEIDFVICDSQAQARGLCA